MTALQHKNPWTGGMKFKILVDSSLVIITILPLCLIFAWVKRRSFLKKKIIYTIWLIWPRQNHKNPCPEGHEIYNFGGSFLGHHYYTLNLSVKCLRVEKILKEIMFFSLHHLYRHLHKNPCPGGHEIHNFGEPFLGHHYHTLSLSNLCLG